MDNLTIYVSPCLVFNETGYSKHCGVYAERSRSTGAERVSSRIGGGMLQAPLDPLSSPLEHLSEQENWEAIANDLLTMLKRGITCTEFDVDRASMESQLFSIGHSATINDPEENWYIYHSDHLGSSSFLTDASGDPTQHLQYMPFGETFIEQRSVTSFYTPYTFSAKERDPETGYSYFGARYYDADISVWLSVDPMADKYPSMSPYMYLAGNPVMLVDPGGDSTVYFNNRGQLLFVSHDILPNSIVIVDPKQEIRFNIWARTITKYNLQDNSYMNQRGRSMGLLFNIVEINEWYHNVLEGEWIKSSYTAGRDVRAEKKSWTTINSSGEISIDEACELGGEGVSTSPKKVPKNKYAAIHSHYLDHITAVGPSFDDYRRKIRASDNKWDILVEGKGGAPYKPSSINAIYFYTNDAFNTITIDSQSFKDKIVNKQYE
jgi:RHS repeat-associated protein